MDQDPEFMSVADIATMVAVSERTVREWIARGTLPAYKAGRMVRIKRADALALFRPITVRSMGGEAQQEYDTSPELRALLSAAAASPTVRRPPRERR